MVSVADVGNPDDGSYTIFESVSVNPPGVFIVKLYVNVDVEFPTRVVHQSPDGGVPGCAKVGKTVLTNVSPQ